MAQQAYAVNKKLQNVQKANFFIDYTVADVAVNQGDIMKFKKCLIQMLTVVGICSLSVSTVMAEKRSINTNKTISEGIKDNPIMAYVVPVYEDIWVSELNSNPDDGSVSLRYNNNEKTRTSLVSAKKLPDNMKAEDSMEHLDKGVRQALGDGKETLVERQFKTDKGHEVECLGFINENEKRSQSMCVSVFDHYYVQTSLAWALDDEERGEEVFSRSDDFVKAVFDKFSEYEGI